MTPWIISGLLLVAVAALMVLWRRAAGARDEAEIKALRTERLVQEARQITRHESAQLAALSLACPDPVLLLTPQLTVQDMNSAARALFGLRSEAGQTLIATTRSVELDELATHTLAGGEDRDRQVALNGQPYRARAAPVGETGELGVVLVLQDLSEVQRLGRARRDFIANISHELRTPLTSIHLLLDNLVSGMARAPDEFTASLEQIGAEVQVLEQMAQELLDLAQIESGQAVVRLVPTPVEDLVANAVERLRPQAEHKHQAMTVEVPAGLTALADAMQVNRALGNLLHNAIKFTPTEGRIWVRAQAHNGEVLVEVADTGPGIAPEDLPRVFERFFRGDRSRRSGGTGLGLAIAKHVVEAHGGKIWVESEGRPGHGATFRFTLLSAD
jgi:two-component system phosphate regulon sensor histidine kinase PhoR